MHMHKNNHGNSEEITFYRMLEMFELSMGYTFFFVLIFFFSFLSTYPNVHTDVSHKRSDFSKLRI